MRVAVIPLLLAACGGTSAPSTPVVSPAPAPTFSGRAIWTPVSAPFVAARLRVVQSNACAVSVDGKVACWGQVEYDDDAVAVERRAGMSTPHVLEGVDGAIDVAKEWHYVCVAQRPDAGDGGCFVTNDIDRTPPVFPSPPVELQAGESGICATMRDGSVGCVDLDGKFTDAGVRNLTQLTCSRDGCCGITAAGAVACFGGTKPKLPTLPPVTAVIVAGDEGCARTRTGGAQCWGDYAKTLTRPSGVRAVALLDYTPCLILDDGTLRCASERIPAASRVAAADYSCVLHTVATGERGSQFHRRHRNRGTRPVARGRFFALAVARRRVHEYGFASAKPSEV